MFLSKRIHQDLQAARERRAFFLADNATALAYRKAAQETLATVTTEAERWHLAYVQVNEASHDMRGEANPYLVAKATFLSQQIPTRSS